uniref:tyrosine--tRNA ligase n=1 Tax=Rhizophora mucronata TaxID=61149 RepID=A0A2P2L6R9_RHIMU
MAEEGQSAPPADETRVGGGNPDVIGAAPEMNLEERFQIVRSVGEECIQEDELMNLLAKKPHPVCYDGFEPSGRMHIAQVLRSNY